MLLKEKLRKFNRKLRNSSLYDQIYLGLRRLVKGELRPKGAGYYHDHYADTHIVQGQVLLDAFWGRTVGCNPYALYLEMRADPRCAHFNYIWVCNETDKIPQQMLDDPAVRFVKYQSLPHQDAMLTSQYLIGNCNFPNHFCKKRDQIYINVWHGTPIKYLGRNAEDQFIPSANTQRHYLFSDYILSNSSVMTDRTVRAYGAEVALNRVYEIGTPRIDLTLKTSRSDVRGMLGVSGTKDILLYAPTWRGNFKDKNDDLETQIKTIKSILTLFSDSHEVFLSVHHVMAKALEESGTRFRTIPDNVPVNIILAGIDLLISDYSSIIIDYLVLDRPIALFCYDYDVYSKTPGLHEDLQDLPVAYCETLRDLKCAIQAAQKPSEFVSYGKYRADLIGLDDGIASRRALNIVFNQNEVASYPTDQRKRILFYAGGFRPNGITSSIIALSNAIDYSKYSVTIVFNAAAMDEDISRQTNLQKLSPQCDFVTRTGTAIFTAAERKAYARFRQTGTYKSPAEEALIDAAFLRETRRIFGDQKYDVAINFSGYDPFWGLVLAHVDAQRRLIYQHNDMKLESENRNADRNFPELPAMFTLYKKYDGIVSVTSEMSKVNKAKLAKYYTNDTSFHSAENVISGDLIRTKAQASLEQVSPKVAALAQSQNLYLFCCVARLSAEKNHERLLDAFAQVHHVTPNCALLLLGSGKLEQQLRKHAQSLGVTDHVLFLGHQENPYAIMKACDCKVLASHYEGQGIVLLEALTLGLKCIATDNPAIRSILQDGVGVITPQDTTALAQAMMEAVKTGKSSSPRFDPDGYATSALQQFYRAIEH